MATDQPIQVNDSTLPTTLASALRHIVAILGTWAVAKGWVNAENVDGIATVAITVVTVGYGIWKAHHRQSQLITTAAAAPNSVARVTS